MSVLPLVVECVSGESWLSYLQRVSRAYALPLKTVARRFGSLQERRVLFDEGFMLEPSETVRDRWHGSQEALDAMFLGRYAHAFGDAWRRDGTRAFALAEWVHVSGSPVCSACLAEGVGHRRLAWSLPWVFVCAEHRTVLSSECPACKSPHGAGRRDGRAAPGFIDFSVDPRACWNPAHSVDQAEQAREKRPCGHDLTTIEQVEVHDAAVLEAQQLIVDVLERRVEPTVFGRPVTPRAWFQDLRTLVAWVLFAGSPEVANGLPRAVQDAWTNFCSERDEHVRKRVGSKGARDHAYSRTPAPLEMLVAVRRVIGILDASQEEAIAEIESLHGMAAWRTALMRTMRDRPGNSVPFRVALHESRLSAASVKAYLTRHPERSGAPAASVAPTVTVDLLERHLPRSTSEVHAAWFVPAANRMVQFFCSRSAVTWNDADLEDDPPALRSQLLRLVTVASKHGEARALGRLIVETALGRVERHAEPPDDRSAPPQETWDVAKHQVGLVPSLYPKPAFERDFAPLFAGVPVTERDARSFASSMIARHASGLDWEDVALACGVDPERAVTGWTRVATLARSVGAYDAVAQRAEAVAGRLVTEPGSVDYGARRAALERFVEIDAMDWARIAALLRVPVGHLGGRSSFAAALAWALVTDSDWRDAPAVRARTGSLDSTRELIRRFEQSAPPELIEALRAYGEYVAQGGVAGAYSQPVGGHPGRRLTYRHVPQLLWEDAYAERFERFFAGLDVGASTARAALSILLLEHVLALPRQRLGEVLELPDLLVGAGVSRAIQLVRGSTNAGALDGTLDGVLANLDADDARVDFQSRRDQLRDFVEVPWDEWRGIAKASGVAPGKRGGKHVHAAMWLWAHLTSGIPRLSPAAREHYSDRPANHLTTVFRSFRVKHLGQVRGSLEAWGAELFPPVSST